MRIERVEDGYMAYVGEHSRHFDTFHEAVLWVKKQLYGSEQENVCFTIFKTMNSQSEE